eukprot:NODE_137_length_18042_cov_0.768823.p13 type:complete len:117 gc:universal NODE_137_length_18042_cov_0.768823:337-687(+)
MPDLDSNNNLCKQEDSDSSNNSKALGSVSGSSVQQLVVLERSRTMEDLDRQLEDLDRQLEDLDKQLEDLDRQLEDLGRSHKLRIPDLDLQILDKPELLVIRINLDSQLITNKVDLV